MGQIPEGLQGGVEEPGQRPHGQNGPSPSHPRPPIFTPRLTDERRRAYHFQTITLIASPSMTEADLEPQQKNLWLKGVSAYQLKNFDYAVNLILTVVKQCPEFLEGRRLLRRAEADKSRGQKKGLFGGGLNLGGL